MQSVKRGPGYRFTTQAIRRHLGKLAKAGILKHTPESWEYEV